LLLGAIAILAAWLRLRHAAASMVYDEMASMYFSGQSWHRLWGWWMLRETNPPLFYSLLKVWRGVLPVGHWTLRALPLSIALAHLVVFVRFVRGRLGWPAALLGLLLFAVSWSDIYQAAYLRGYGLAKLAVLVSFIGLLHALEHRRLRGWLGYVLGAVVAIYCHTTMVLWPVIATIAVIADAAWRRDRDWRPIAALIAADCATTVLSGWVLVMALAQIRGAAAANLNWIAPLGWDDFVTTCNLQLLTGGTISALLVAALVLVGAWRGRHRRDVRLAVMVVVGTVVLFKAADRVHPIVSDFTLHWCFSFVALIAGAALMAGRPCHDSPQPAMIGTDQAPPLQGRVWGGAYPPGLTQRRSPTPGPTPEGEGGKRRHHPRLVSGEDPAHAVLRRASALAVLASVALAGLVDLLVIDYIGPPQDWRYAVHAVADDPGALMLASHESEGVVIEQTCLIEFGSTQCPFPLVVLTDPRRTDNWADGGYHGHLVAPADARAAMRGSRVVYAFSRYFYTPLQHLGLNPRRWFEVMWDDGELIGPIPVHAFDPPGPGEPPRVPDPNAEYTGAPSDGP
jgi:type IV secretory pathway VirB2 component (pilin)